MDDEKLTIRSIPNWLGWITGEEHPGIGEQDRHGRTVLQIIPVDERRRDELRCQADALDQDRDAIYAKGSFEKGWIAYEDDGIEREMPGWVPVETDETRALGDRIDSLRAEADGMRDQWVYDRELTDEERSENERRSIARRTDTPFLRCIGGTSVGSVRWGLAFTTDHNSEEESSAQE